MKKCICEICTCGRHRCPHRPVAKIRKGSSACLLSEYKQTFTHFPAKPRESFKPAYKPIERSGTLETKTTHRNDYVPHPLQAKSTQPVVTYAQPEKPMETQTEYAREFPEKQPEVRSPKKVIYVSHPEAAPFDGTTTQRHDFKAWTGTGPSQSFKVSRIYTPPKDKFQAISTFQRDFAMNGHIVPRESLRPPQVAFKSHAPFDDTTTNRTDFRLFSSSAPERPRPKSNAVVNRQKFIAKTTNQTDFVAPTGIERPKCVRPAMEMKAVRAPFEGQTTHSLSYVPWKTPPRAGFQPKFNYIPPTAKFNHMTTTQLEYVPYGLVERANPSKAPERANNGPSAPFEGMTTHRHDFQAWDARPQECLRQNFTYKPPDVPFAAQSTFQAHFQGKPTPHPAKSAKPVDTRAGYDGLPFDGSTMYQDTFTMKEVGPCPAACLRDIYTPPVHDPFVYSHQAPTGHKFYMPLGYYQKTQRRLSKSMPDILS